MCRSVVVCVFLYQHKANNCHRMSQRWEQQRVRIRHVLDTADGVSAHVIFVALRRMWKVKNVVDSNVFNINTHIYLVYIGSQSFQLFSLFFSLLSFPFTSLFENPNRNCTLFIRFSTAKEFMFMFSIVYDYYLSSLENICTALPFAEALVCASISFTVIGLHRERMWHIKRKIRLSDQNLTHFCRRWMAWAGSHHIFFCMNSIWKALQFLMRSSSSFSCVKMGKIWQKQRIVYVFLWHCNHEKRRMWELEKCVWKNPSFSFQTENLFGSSAGGDAIFSHYTLHCWPFSSIQFTVGQSMRLNALANAKLWIWAYIVSFSDGVAKLQMRYEFEINIGRGEKCSIRELFRRYFGRTTEFHFDSESHVRFISGYMIVVDRGFYVILIRNAHVWSFVCRHVRLYIPIFYLFNENQRTSKSQQSYYDSCFISNARRKIWRKQIKVRASQRWSTYWSDLTFGGRTTGENGSESNQ